MYVKWTKELDDKLWELRTQGLSWEQCGKELGVSPHRARKAGLALGLPRRIGFGPYSGVQVVRDRLEIKARHPDDIIRPREEPLRMAALLHPMQVGDKISIEALTSREVKAVHSRVSRYGSLHNKGFRGKLDWRRQVIVVERVR